MSEKAKVGKPAKRRINRYVFLAMWIIVQPLARYIFYLMIINGSPMFLPYREIMILNGLYLGLVHGIIIAVIQKAALYLHFGRSFKGWIRATILGWMLGGIGLMTINWNMNLPSQLILIFQAITMTMPPILAQALILRGSIRQAWLWPFSAIVGAIVFAGIMEQFSFNNTIEYSSFAVYGAVTGLTLIWLFGMQASQNQSKNIAATSRLEDRAADSETGTTELDEGSNVYERESES